MMNFNTNQVRQLYVALAVPSDGAAVSNNGDIQVVQDSSNNFYLSYKNADGLVTRSDTINVAKLTKLNLTAAAAMATPLMQHTVAVDTSAVTLSELEGETFTLTIHLRQVLGYSDNDSIAVTASVVGDSTNTASAAAFHKALAMAIAKALPKREYPYLRVFSNGSEVTATTPAGSVVGAAGGVVLVECPQKYVRGKMSNEPIRFDVEFHLHGSNTDDTPWGTDTIAVSSVSGYTVIPGYYKVADLEYFALGERADIYRGAYWPNDVQPTYMVDISGSTAYSIVSIEYYYNGDAENVQKSPKLIQVAAASAVASALYEAIDAIVNPVTAEAEPAEGGNG